MDDYRLSNSRRLAGAVVLLLLGCNQTFLVGSYDPDSGGSDRPDSGSSSDADSGGSIDADSGGSVDADSGDSPTSTWRLVWRDEFDGPAGSAPNAAMWTYDVGGGGWGNGELQFYTARTQNAFLDGDGTLVIHAAVEPYMGEGYTSARVKTQGLFQQAYGRFEARARVPGGQGLWSTFLIFGNDRDAIGWPQCGDINVMSVLSSDPTVNRGGAHGPGYGENVRPLGSLPGSPSLSDDFHLYAVEWETAELRYYLDDVLYATRRPADLPSGATWVQDHPYFLLLSLAVGGRGATPNASAFPADLRVQFVRVYAR